jgi:hypothetical protein
MSRWPILVPLLFVPMSAWADDDGFEAITAFPLLGAFVAFVIFAVTAPIVLVALLPHLEGLAGVRHLPALPRSAPPPPAPSEAAGEGAVTLDGSVRRPW